MLVQHYIDNQKFSEQESAYFNVLCTIANGLKFIELRTSNVNIL